MEEPPKDYAVSDEDGTWRPVKISRRGGLITGYIIGIVTGLWLATWLLY